MLHLLQHYSLSPRVEEQDDEEFSALLISVLSGWNSHFSFKRTKTEFEFPLLLGSLAGLEKSRARGRGFFRSWSIVRACWNNATEGIRRAPQTCAAQKAVFQASANHVLEVSVVEIVSLNRADVLMRQVDARDTLVIRRKRHRHAKQPVQWEWMIFAGHAEDHVIACQADFHHHVIRGHLFQNRVRLIFVHDVHTVTNSLGLSLLDRQPNVAAQTLIRNEPSRNLACCQTPVRLPHQHLKQRHYPPSTPLA